MLFFYYRNIGEFIMSEFRDLVTAAKTLRDELEILSRKLDSAPVETYEKVRIEYSNKTNQYFDAVNNLNNYIKTETGVSSFDLNQLFYSRGYDIGEGITPPTTLVRKNG